MAGLKSLNAAGLPEAFDLNHHGEKPIVRMAVSDDAIHLSYTFPGFRLSHPPGRTRAAPGDRNAYYNEVGIAGTGFLSESGKPLLPSFGRFVQIPPGHHYTVHIRKGPFRRRHNLRIKPAQENARDQQAGEFEFDETVYTEDRFYPQALVDVSPPLFMDGYRVLCLHVRPFQYNPVRELMRCYSNIEVTIRLHREALVASLNETAGGEVPLWAYLEHKRGLEGFGNLLFNPGRRTFDGRRPAMGTLAPRQDVDPRPAFLIIHGPAFANPARRLQAWKEKLGLSTAVVPVSAIFDAAGDPREAQIRKLKEYIRRRRGEDWSPLRYVLFFGDIATIPSEERQLPGAHSSPLFDTTDYYYFTHRDAREAECILPWVAGGRIPVQTEAEGHAVVNQIIRYEQDPPDDPAYFERMTVAAYFEDCDAQGRQDGRADKAYLKTMETVRAHMISHGFAVHRVYVANTRTPKRYADGTPVPPKVGAAMIYKRDGARATKRLIDRINAGQLIMGHRGHGDQRGWQNPPLRTDDLKKIASDHPSIFFSINCRTGSFDGGRVCFAEQILALDGGAPSLIAATELSGAWRNDSMIKALFDAIWPGILPSYPATADAIQYPVKYYRLGDVMNYAKAYLLIAHGVNANTQKHHEIYHVIGDPSLQIWGRAPLALRLRARLNGDTLIVNMNTCPQEGFLSVWFGEDCVLKSKPQGTRLAIPLRHLSSLPADVQDPAREQTYKLTIYFAAPGHRLAVSELWF
jgi:hypothetical protein